MCPQTLAARTRLLGNGRTNKNDPNDALSVAVTALRHRQLRTVAAAGYSELLRLLAKRHIDLSNQRSRLVARLHALATELSPGGIAKRLNSIDAAKFLADITPTDAVVQLRWDLIAELADDIARIEAQIKRQSAVGWINDVPRSTFQRRALALVEDNWETTSPVSSMPTTCAASDCSRPSAGEPSPWDDHELWIGEL